MSSISKLMSLTDRVAVVTGAGRGIGAACAHRLADLGASVVLVDVKKKEAEETCSQLSTDQNQQHFAVHCDVSGADFVKQLRDYLVSTYPKAPQILVNNAGITMDGKLHDIDERQWDWVLNINLKGTFLMTQAFTEAMVKQQLPGSVINLSSIVGKAGNFGQTNYAASKSGVIGLTKTVAQEMGRKGIRCNAILPGFIETDMTGKVPQPVLEKVRQQIPLGHMGEPNDIADTVAFLASDMSKYITGAAIEVTGGLLM